MSVWSGKEVWRSGESVYVITHDLELILDCCTDVVYFENGQISEQYELDDGGVERLKAYFMQS